MLRTSTTKPTSEATSKSTNSRIERVEWPMVKNGNATSIILLSNSRLAISRGFSRSQPCQLVINTGTTIITFLMVFLIQNSQNRDGAAIQVKLDELIRVSAAKNFFVGIEHLTDDEIERLRAMCEARAKGGNRRVARVEAKAEEAADRAG
jgi:low affinity Fe/Cu permease